MPQVDDFDLNVDSPSAAGAASPDVAPQPAVEAAELAAESSTAHHTGSKSVATGEDKHDAMSAYTAQWLHAIPSPDAPAGKGASNNKLDPCRNADDARPDVAPRIESSQKKGSPAGQSLEKACSEASRAAEVPLPAAAAGTTERRLTLTAPEDEACDGEI